MGKNDHHAKAEANQGYRYLVRSRQATPIRWAIVALALIAAAYAPARAQSRSSIDSEPVPVAASVADIRAYCAMHLKGGDAVEYCVDLLTDNGGPTYCFSGESNGWTAELVDECAREHVAEMVARDGRTWFARKDYEKGLSSAEAHLVDQRGIPCNRSSYVQGESTFEEFWYCVDGVQNESFTFLNGTLLSHSNGGNPP